MAFACAVGRIDEDGEVAAFFYRGDYRQIQSVAGKVGESADAAFAEHDVVVTFGKDVFGGHEEFIESGGHAALQEDGEFRAARAFEEGKVLHVAGADLDHVGVFLDEVERFVVDGFGDDAETELLANFSEDFQAGEPEALEGVGRGAWLVGATSEEMDARGMELLGHGYTLLFGFYRAGAGNHGDVLAADEDLTGGRRNFDDGIFFFDIAGDQLVGLGDGDAFDDAGHGFEEAEVDGAGIAGDADGGSRGARDGMRFHAERIDAITDGADLFVGGVGLHNYEHGRVLFWVWLV